MRAYYDAVNDALAVGSSREQALQILAGVFGQLAEHAELDGAQQRLGCPEGGTYLHDVGRG